MFMKEAELLLIESRESLEFALQSGRMGTWDINLETGTISCSQEMLDLWGVSAHEFKNQRSILQSKVHPEDLEKMNLEIDSAIQNRSVYELEYRIIPQPGKERWVLSRGRCTFAPNSDHPHRFAGIVHDITERKVKEQELAKAVKARNDFFTIASHELKTPLTCLQLQIEVMHWQLKQISSDLLTTDLISSGLKKQQGHLERISRIVDNILDESKISEGRFPLQLEMFDLSEMVASVLEQMKLNAELAGVEIKFNSLQKVFGNWDRHRLEQVLLNLLINAIRYGNKKPIHVEVTNDGTHASMKVSDEGIGIKSEDHSRIFQRFERANPEKEISGMGLGLFISSNIVKAHGGEIHLKSEIDKGSEFTVIIPCNPAC